MLEPYSELPPGYSGDPRGKMNFADQIMMDATAGWAAAGYQVNTHCIGDACNRLVLNAIEAAGSKALDERGALRHRVEHARECDTFSTCACLFCCG